MSDGTEQRPTAVPCGAQQAGEAHADLSRWSWTERCVWTERMLTALETNNVKGGVWFRLIDKVFALRTLRAAFARVRANDGAAGVDHQTVRRFDQRLESNLERIAESLRERSYRPQAIRRVHIPKPGRREKRPLGIPTVRDRVVQAALRSVIEPIFEREFAEHSYGFRPNRGCKDALRRVDRLLRQGHCWVVDADLRSYFDTIPHGRLMGRVKERIADGRVLGLIESFLEQGVMETARTWAPRLDEGRGTPQGAVISPLLSNVYLNPLDHRMVQEGLEMVRYADDFVILCPSEADARRALGIVEEWVRTNGLSLHPEKTRLVNMAEGEGFEFLGYHFRRGRHWPSRTSRQRLQEAIRTKTRRTRGESLGTIITEVNQTVRGWFEYFKHCRPYHYAQLDGWIRMRLRSILRKRHRGRGRERRSDHIRWPNTYFVEQGLYSMSTAHAAACRSASR